MTPEREVFVAFWRPTENGHQPTHINPDFVTGVSCVFDQQDILARRDTTLQWQGPTGQISLNRHPTENGPIHTLAFTPPNEDEPLFQLIYLSDGEVTSYRGEVEINQAGMLLAPFLYQAPILKEAQE